MLHRGDRISSNIWKVTSLSLSFPPPACPAPCFAVLSNPRECLSRVAVRAQLSRDSRWQCRSSCSDQCSQVPAASLRLPVVPGAPCAIAHLHPRRQQHACPPCDFWWGRGVALLGSLAQPSPHIDLQAATHRAP